MGNTPSLVPSGAQLNKIYVGLDCYAGPNNAHSEIAFTLTSTAPLSAGSGQDIYYSDLYPTILLPLFLNASAYTSNVSIELDLLNALQPSVVFSGPASIRKGDLAPGLSAGPVTLGAAGITHSFSLGQVNITLQNKGSEDPPVFYTCPPPVSVRPAILGSVNVDTTSGPALAPYTGSRDGYPDVMPGQKGTVASIPLNCQAGITGSNAETFNVSLSGLTPVALSPAQNFSITSETNFITIPNSIVRAFAGFYGNDQTQIGLGLGQSAPRVASGQTGYGWAVSNASPSMLDLAFNFTASDANDTPNPWSGSYKVESNTTEPLTLGFPLDGSLSIGPFSAASSGSVFSIAVTGLSGIIASPGVGQTPFSCSLVSGVVLFSTPIS